MAKTFFWLTTKTVILNIIQNQKYIFFITFCVNLKNVCPHKSKRILVSIFGSDNNCEVIYSCKRIVKTSILIKTTKFCFIFLDEETNFGELLLLISGIFTLFS